jgi:transcriptional regulator of acetoin/glycerol metabolism
MKREQQLIRSAVEEAIQMLNSGYDDSLASRLSMITRLITTKIQKSLLLDTLTSCNWNMKEASERLRLSNNTVVIRLLKEVAPKEYTEARKKRLVKRGGYRARKAA